MFNTNEVLKNGLNIDFLEFLISLDVRLFKKKFNSKYLKVDIIKIYDERQIIKIDHSSDIIIFLILLDGHFSTIYYDK